MAIALFFLVLSQFILGCGDSTPKNVNQAFANHISGDWMNDKDGLETLLESGADPNTKSASGEAALPSLILFYPERENKGYGQKQVEMVKLLLDHGANPDTRIGGQPALLALSYFSHQENSVVLAKMLLEKGAEPNASFQGTTALISTLSKDIVKQDLEFAQILLNYGADPNMTADSEPGFFPALHRIGLFPSIEPIHLDFAELLLKNLANPNQLNVYGLTPLAQLCERPPERWENAIAYAKLLLKYGANPELRSKNGKLPRDILREAMDSQHSSEYSGSAQILLGLMKD